MQAEQNKDPTERQMTKIAREAAKFTVQMMKADALARQSLILFIWYATTPA